MDPPATFGEWLRRRRTFLHLTRKQLAQRVGCSVSAIRKIEDGERRPSCQVAELLANGLNLPLALHLTFLKVARGELSLERLPSPDMETGSAPARPALRENVPILPTPLIGRRRELNELDRLLRDPHCRLITLVGPGGIGKTRLAIEAASNAQPLFADGAFFVPLASLESPGYIVPAIARALGVTFYSTGPVEPRAQLLNYLREKRALLVLDNVEHLLAEQGPEVIADLLYHAPGVKLLVTSRETLNVQEEWVFEVQGLPIPDRASAEEAGEAGAVELFFQRARRANVRFNATPRDEEAIIRICRFVEGMPLGIELAATWVRTLSCEEIARELERGLDFLAVSARDLPARHRSLRAVFEHSWKLLGEDERGVLRRAAIFQGGFRREAAEQVAGASLPLLSALIAKSLLRRAEASRYDLHELIRQYAAAHLAACPDEQAATQERHAHYYMTLFGDRDNRLRSAAQAETLAELTAEIDNIRIAREWALARGEFALIGRTMRAFAWFYDIRGWLQEGIDFLDRVVDAMEAAGRGSPLGRTEQITLGHALSCQALLTFRQGQHGRALAILERSLAILRPLNVPEVLVEAVTFRGVVSLMMGDELRARRYIDEGLALAEAAGDPWFQAVCLLNQGLIAGMRGGYPEAHERSQAAVEVWRATGDPRFTALGLNFSSLNAIARGRFDEARAALEESVMLNSSVGDRWGLGTAYRNLGLVAQARDDHAEARALFEKSLDLHTDLGADWDLARTLADMGRSVAASGDDAEAERIWRRALRIATETRGTPVALEAVVGLASLRAKRAQPGDPARAFELLVRVLDHPNASEETKERARRLCEQLEPRLAPAEIEMAREQVQSRTFEAVVDELLSRSCQSAR